MFCLTPQERKVLTFIAVLILCGATLRFFNVRIKSKTEDFSAQNIQTITFPININEAAQNELENIPGIGPALAIRIIAYRSQNGGFSSLEELTKVKGIGNKKVQMIKDYIFFK